jgi:hypothetical protein
MYVRVRKRDRRMSEVYVLCVLGKSEMKKIQQFLLFLT